MDVSGNYTRTVASVAGAGDGIGRAGEIGGRAFAVAGGVARADDGRWAPATSGAGVWSAVGSMALCVALLIAAEFMPVSLLTPIANDLGATVGMAGQAISISGLFAVITSLFIATFAARFDRRHVLARGHQVLLHARNEKRGREALDEVPGAEGVVTADLGNVGETKQLASNVNALGDFDAVIHNAGVYIASAEEIFTVDTLAPYVLTCLIRRPKRLIYLSSDMHLQGRPKLESFRTKTGRVTYSDSKLHVLMLCTAVARKRPQVYANAVDPGWVPTKMGGQGAPDDLQKGYETQVWLAVSDDEKAKVSGRYFHHRKESRHNPEADDASLQERFLSLCEEMTGVSFP